MKQVTIILSYVLLTFSAKTQTGETTLTDKQYFVTTIQSTYTKGKFLNDLHDIKLDTVPGVKFSYSNAGAQLLSFILY